MPWIVLSRTVHQRLKHGQLLFKPQHSEGRNSWISVSLSPILVYIAVYNSKFWATLGYIVFSHVYNLKKDVTKYSPAVSRRGTHDLMADPGESLSFQYLTLPAQCWISKGKVCLPWLCLPRAYSFLLPSAQPIQQIMLPNG